MPTVTRTLQLAPVACYLAANNVAKKNGLKGGSVNSRQTDAIYTTYVILKKIYDEDQTYTNIQVLSDYLYELIGEWAFAAAKVVDGGGGGQIAPPSGGTAATSIYPFIITSSDFESDGVSYNNADIVGDTLTIFINEYSQQWLTASPTTFTHTVTGIQILIDGFDANTYSYTIMIQQLNS